MDHVEVNPSFGPAGSFQTRDRFMFTWPWWTMVVILELAVGVSFVLWPLSAVFLIAGAVVVSLLVKTRLSYFLLALLLLPSPCIHFTIDYINLSIAHILIYLTMLSWLLNRMAGNRRPYPGTEIDLPLVFFGLWAFLSLTWSQDKPAGFHDGLILLASFAFFFLTVSLIRTRKSLLMLFYILIFVGIIDAVLSIMFPFFTYYIAEVYELTDMINFKLDFWLKHTINPEGRSSGFGDQHVTAAVLTIPMVFAVMLYLVHPGKWVRRFFFFLLLVMWAGTITTMSKGPIGAVMIGTAYVVLRLSKTRKWFFTAMVVLLAVTIFFFIVTRIETLGIATAQLADSVQSTTSNPDKVSSLDNRRISITIGLQKLYETGGLGTGLGGYNQYLPWLHIDGAHPIVLFDFGFIGFILYCWVLLEAFLRCNRASRSSRSEFYRRFLVVYIGGYIAVIISWIVSFSYIHTYLWFYIAVGQVLVRLADQAEPDSPGEPAFFDQGEPIVVPLINQETRRHPGL